MFIKMISLVILIKNTYNLKKKMGYQIIKFIKINPNLKYFEIMMAFSYNNRKIHIIMITCM